MEELQTYPPNVLAVDADESLLLALEKVMEDCNYKVTKCKDAEQCLSVFRESQVKFDLVIIDVCIPKIDGYELCRLLRAESDVPIILMSSTYSNADPIKKALDHGASDFLLKPITPEHLRKMDLDALRYKPRSSTLVKQEVSYGEEEQEISATSSLKRDASTKKRKGDSLDPPARKKRVVWSSELHNLFVKAVNKLGLERAVPKKIMELMNIPGLTRENVASHLQKYRQHLKKQQGDSQEKQPRKQQQKQERHQKEVVPDQDVIKMVLPVSTMQPQREVEELNIKSEQGMHNFNIGSHQPLAWTVPTVYNTYNIGNFSTKVDWIQQSVYNQMGYVGSSNVNHIMDQQLSSESGGLLNNHPIDILPYELDLPDDHFDSIQELFLTPKIEFHADDSYNSYVASINQGEQHNYNVVAGLNYDDHQQHPQTMLNSSYCDVPHDLYYDQFNQEKAETDEFDLKKFVP